jgi:hypothetical protein
MDEVTVFGVEVKRPTDDEAPTAGSWFSFWAEMKDLWLLGGYENEMAGVRHRND